MLSSPFFEILTSISYSTIQKTLEYQFCENWIGQLKSKCALYDYNAVQGIKVAKFNFGDYIICAKFYI